MLQKTFVCDCFAGLFHENPVAVCDLSWLYPQPGRYRTSELTVMRNLLRALLCATAMGVVATAGMGPSKAAPPQGTIFSTEDFGINDHVILVADTKKTPAQILQQMQRSMAYISNSYRRMPAANRNRSVAFANALRNAAQAVSQLKGAANKRDPKRFARQLNAASVAIGKLNTAYGMAKLNNPAIKTGLTALNKAYPRFLQQVGKGAPKANKAKRQANNRRITGLRTNRERSRPTLSSRRQKFPVCAHCWQKLIAQSGSIDWVIRTGSSQAC
jgi:hypothetical protein